MYTFASRFASTLFCSSRPSKNGSNKVLLLSMQTYPYKDFLELRWVNQSLYIALCQESNRRTVITGVMTWEVEGIVHLQANPYLHHIKGFSGSPRTYKVNGITKNVSEKCSLEELSGD